MTAARKVHLQRRRAPGPSLLHLQPVAFEAARPRRVRSWREFAEAEMVLPTGPREGLHFDLGFMPWMGLVLDEFQRGRYRHFYATGPTQSGKTLLFLQLPALYHLFEMEQDVGLGAPTVDQAREIYEERILPAIASSRFERLLPRRGSGSRGGKPRLSVMFENGVRLRFMGAKGGDESRSSYTIPVLLLTELDKMAEASGKSLEAGPASQMIARTDAWGALARVYAESTPTRSSGRIWREVTEFGTYSRPFFPCPKCGEFVPLERDSFGGWQEAPDELAAMERATFACPSCSAPWSETDRAAALARPVLVARGQSVDRDGVAAGEPPRTMSFGLRWTCLASSLLTMADIGRAEHLAERTGTDEAERLVAQFKWAMPHDGAAADLIGVSPELVLSKIAAPARGMVPPGTFRLTVGADVGLRSLHWVAVAWMEDARGHVVDYGARQVAHADPERPDRLNVLAALRGLRDEVWAQGWGGRVPDLVLVDSGFETDLIYRFAAEPGSARVLPSKGRGSGDAEGAWRSGVQSTATRHVGTDYQIVLLPNSLRLVELHADRWKHEIHAGLILGAGAPGSLTIYQESPRHHLVFAQHLTAEREEEVERPSGRVDRVWVVRSKRNHWLDAIYTARGAAEMLGVRLARPAAAPVSESPPGITPDRRQSLIRRVF